MKRVRVKICGITRLEDLYASVEAGADAIGFIVDVHNSPRNLSLEMAKRLLDETPIFVQKVVVTVFRDLNRLSEICQELEPDAVQLHGDLSSERTVREKLRQIRLIGAVHVNSENSVDTATRSAAFFDGVLADSYVAGRYGGTGISHNWAVSRAIKESIRPKPLILAGGLSPENVRDAILAVEPYAVDVSSGVEAEPGIKDREKIISFMEAVRKSERCVN